MHGVSTVANNQLSFGLSVLHNVRERPLNSEGFLYPVHLFSLSVFH